MLRAKAASRVYLLASLCLGVAAVSAQPVDLSAYRGRQNVVLVLFSSQDDDRPFVFNLAVSSNWDLVNSYDIAVVEVSAFSHDISRVRRQFELGDRRFAVVLIDKQGRVIMTTSDPDALPEIFDALDEQQRAAGNEG
jgi:hypothetical protein